MAEAEPDSPIWLLTDYESAWRPFNRRFDFEPDFHERDAPAIDLTDDCLVLDLSPAFARDGARFAVAEAAVNASALRAFVWLTDDEPMTALD